MGLNSGPVLAVFAFILWGLTPLFYHLLLGASAPELLAQRLLWSVPLLLIARLFIKGRTTWQEVWRDKQSLFCCLAGGVVMSMSWTTFAYALTHDQVLAASLGYFMNPLFSIALGVIFLHDKLSTFQKVAVLLALTGLSYQIWQYGQMPVLALIMGTAFAFYGLIRKFIRYDIMTALTMETLWLVPAAIAVTLWLTSHGESALVDATLTTRLLYALSAPATLLPLFFFAAAIKRTSLTVVGLAQYVEPSLQFLLAVWVFGEAFDDIKAVSFSLIWLGLLCCIYELIRQHWRYRHLPQASSTIIDSADKSR